MGLFNEKLAGIIRDNIDTALVEHAERLKSQGWNPCVVAAAMSSALCSQAALIFSSMISADDSDEESAKLYEEINHALVEVLQRAVKLRGKERW